MVSISCHHSQQLYNKDGQLYGHQLQLHSDGGNVQIPVSTCWLVGHAAAGHVGGIPSAGNTTGFRCPALPRQDCVPGDIGSQGYGLQSQLQYQPISD